MKPEYKLYDLVEGPLPIHCFNTLKEAEKAAKERHEATDGNCRLLLYKRFISVTGRLKETVERLTF